MYSNACYFHALTRCSALARELEMHPDARELEGLAERVRDGLNARLSPDDRGFFANTDTLDNFASDGNLLAIVRGIADEVQAAHILEACKPHQRPVEARRPGRVSHALLLAVARRAARPGGPPLRARGPGERATRPHGRLIMDHGGVWEVYNRAGRPASTHLYRAETPFLWNAAMHMWAAAEIEGRPLEEVRSG